MDRSDTLFLTLDLLRRILSMLVRCLTQADQAHPKVIIFFFYPKLFTASQRPTVSINTISSLTVCIPGSSDPLKKKYLIYLHQKMRFTPFLN